MENLPCSSENKPGGGANPFFICGTTAAERYQTVPPRSTQPKKSIQPLQNVLLKPCNYKLCIEALKRFLKFYLRY